jgi:hypothetical protein
MLMKAETLFWQRDERIFEVAVRSARHAYLDVGGDGPLFEEIGKFQVVSLKLVEPIDEETDGMER